METEVTAVRGKAWWESKTVWFNGLLLIVETSALLQGMVPDPKVLATLAFIHGFGNLVLRIFFTASPIGELKISGEASDGDSASTTGLG